VVEQDGHNSDRTKTVETGKMRKARWSDKIERFRCLV
jgi:hypothetical protein